MGFFYHDNLLSLSAAQAGVQIQSGSFAVSNLMISSGQDPSHYNNLGDVHTLNTTNPAPALPGLDFTVGRHKTDAVGDFWNNYVRPYQTTANDSPGALNFAFTGALTLQLNNPAITVTMLNMVIGQGSWTYTGGPAAGALGPPTSTISNWWVGGQQCSSEADSTAKCFGLDQNNNIWYFHFNRLEKDASSDRNTLFLTKVSNTAA